jgi:hypothetical protein
MNLKSYLEERAVSRIRTKFARHSVVWFSSLSASLLSGIFSNSAAVPRRWHSM